MESRQRKSFRFLTTRSAVLVVLLALPVVVYAIVGSVAVWQIGWMGWLWWLIPAVWLLTWLVAWLWPVRPSPETLPPGSGHWTPRDAGAAEIVQRYQKQVDSLSPAELTDLHFYLSQAQSLARDVSRHYRPDAPDPVTSLTVPEVIAAFRLVADDLEKLVLESVPGSRLMTIGHWQALAQAPKWIRHITNTVWAGAILLNPLNIARYGSSRATTDRVAAGVQSELLATVYLRFVRQVGFYLIEMNSGRLRGGADAWRATFESEPGQNGLSGDAVTDETRGEKAAPTSVDGSVEIALVGQTSAGKSSLINALVGRSDARVDVLPATRAIQRCQLSLEGQPHTITLLDTPGYGQAGATAAQAELIESALEQADAVLLVLDAHAPARDADKATLQRVRDHYRANPRLKPPPIIAVLTHIDLLSPVMQWTPPYDWREGTSPKEISIAGAIGYTHEILGEFVADVVPVCTSDDEQRQWGVVSNLVPALVAQLDQARSVSVLSAFERALGRHRIKTLLQQATSSGRKMVLAWLQERAGRS